MDNPINRWAESFLIFGKYQKHPMVDAQHDVIYVDPRISKDDISPSDLERLEELGWCWDTKHDCWSIYT